ncbi:hypothetical protein M422DRAFT_239233 [Sphaerobolus stellatus SS14]|nr:hypothetical protein M422DRAFT_239233 [Sphaerobolus stellatus SS14]
MWISAFKRSHVPKTSFTANDDGARPRARLFIARPKSTSPIIQSADDAKVARVLLETPLSTLKAEDRLGPEEREGELVDMLAKMTGRVEELGGLLAQVYKNQTDLETALTLTRSNHQLALANDKVLEDALKCTGEKGKDIDWRSGFPYHIRPHPSLTPFVTSGPSTTSGLRSALPPPPPGLSQKEKLRMKAEELAAAKEQLEDKLESSVGFS